MDDEFKEKINAISVWTKESDTREQSEYRISFHEQEDGLVLVRGARGSFEYRLKPLQELFSPGTTAGVVMKTDDPRNLQLLHSIEGAIKREYEKDRSLVDSSVMLALDKLAVKPESASDDVLVRAIQNSLRLLLSEQDYSRDEVKMAVRKILASVKRHKAAAGIRGYLDFIMEYVL